MSYTQEQVQAIIDAIGAKTAGRLEGIRKDVDEQKDQLDAIERAVALVGAPNLRAAYGEPSGTQGLTRADLAQRTGEFAQSVANAMRPGGRIDDRLARTQALASGGSESVPADGGFMVDKSLLAPLLSNMYAVGLVAPRCNKITVGPNSNGIRLPAVDESSRVDGSRWGGILGYWVGEAGTVTKSRPKIRQMELSLHKLCALCYVTDELLQDAPALGAMLTQGFTDELAFRLDDAIINGTGVGQPLGIIASGALVSVPKETGQRAATVQYENVVKMFSRMPARNRKNAVWFVNQDVEPQLFSMSLSVGTGGVPVYMPAGGASGEPFSTLFNRPVVPIEQCQTLGTVGDILFVDPTFYLLIDKGGIQAASSIHLAFLSDEMAFRWVLRTDGQPMVKAPITPFKGSATVSPFVGLDTRA